MHVVDVSPMEIVDVLLEREATLNSARTGNALRMLTESILASIHTIRFAEEWNTLDNIQKKDFRTRAFARRFPDDIGDQAKFKIFNNRYKKVILARNLLRRLFLKFHVAVLLDPIWTPIASYEKGTTNRSPTFTVILDHILKTTPSARYFHSNMTVFVQLINILFAQNTVNYVIAFLACY